MAMNSIIATVIDPTTIKDGFRRIKLRWLGRGAIREVIHAKEPGTDTNPQPSTKMLLVKTLNPKEDVVAMSVDDRNTREDLKPGEKAFFSYDKDGNPLFIITIRGDKMEVGTAPDGTPPSNSAVRFNEMKIAFDDLQGKWNEFANAYTPGSPTTPGTPPTATPSTASIDDAKSTELTLN